MTDIGAEVPGSCLHYLLQTMEDVVSSEHQQAMIASGAREFVQFGEMEYVLRHEAAVWHSVLQGTTGMAPSRVRVEEVAA
jgi:hypothetical protein